VSLAFHDVSSNRQLDRRSIRPSHIAALCCLISLSYGTHLPAADVFFNIELISETAVPGADYPRHCGDLWAEGNYAYIGSDRHEGGISIFDISNPLSPQFVTEYAGEEMEDVEVYGRFGYFSSDDNQATPATGTGVDIVDLIDPANPVRIARVDASLNGHHKVHTLSVSDGFMYTTDNITDTIKIFNVLDPYAPSYVTTVDLDLASNVDSHEVMVSDGRMYVASKIPGNATTGYTHIFDVSNVGTTGPVLLKGFQTGGGTHTSMPSEDGNLLIVSQERQNGEVRIYDISMIDQPNDPQNPVLLKTITASTLGIEAHSPHHSHMHGDLLFLSWYEAGLQVLNLADPVNPAWVGSYDTFVGTSSDYNGNWGAFHGLGFDKVLLSDRNKGLIIVDASGVAPNGDFNADGTVDGRDLLIWQCNLGTTSAALADGDGNRDRTVNSADLAVWMEQYGQSNHHHGHSLAVPESSTLVLLLGAAPLLARLRFS
jgi:hypothetical protein